MIHFNPETLQPEKRSVRTIKGVEYTFTFPARYGSSRAYIDNCAANAQRALESNFDLACEAYALELLRAAKAKLFPTGGVSKELKEFMEKL